MKVCSATYLITQTITYIAKKGYTSPMYDDKTNFLRKQRRKAMISPRTSILLLNDETTMVKKLGIFYRSRSTAWTSTLSMINALTGLIRRTKTSRALITGLTVTLALSAPSWVQAQTIGEASGKKITVITPKKEVEQVDSAQIDEERFEIGAFVGSLSVQEFDTVFLAGITGSFHINSRFMASLRYGQSNPVEASFERFNEGVNFVPDRDDGFRFVALEGSIKISETRSYLGKRDRYKYSSRLYFDLGIENVQFAGNDEIGFSLGLNYKVVVTDWLTANLIFKDHIVEREFLGEDKLSQNLEISIGFSGLF